MSPALGEYLSMDEKLKPSHLSRGSPGSTYLNDTGTVRETVTQTTRLLSTWFVRLELCVLFVISNVGDLLQRATNESNRIEVSK